MGLFDSAFEDMEGNEEMDRASAFAGVLLSAVACDGHISDEEAQGLSVILSRMKMYEAMSGQKFNRMRDRLMGILKRQGHETLLELSVSGLPEDLHETAFAQACDLVLADQGIEDEEKEFLSDLQRRLGLDRDQALKIFKVMVIKNRG